MRKPPGQRADSLDGPRRGATLRASLRAPGPQASGGRGCCVRSASRKARLAPDSAASAGLVIPRRAPAAKRPTALTRTSAGSAARDSPLTSAATPWHPGSHIPRHLAERILTSKAALEGERKQVTVLFADLKGSTELLADRDPEESRKLLDPVLDRMMEAVHYYEGTVNQVMGDGIMALFGAPLAHEDHAVRGCYAALRMQESVKRYAEEVLQSAGVPIHIRVGLNSGEVVVRSIGNDLHMDYTAVGQTTHLAARMEQTALPDTILIPGTMLSLTRDAVAAIRSARGPMKGLAAPIEVYEVTGASTTRLATAGRDRARPHALRRAARRDDHAAAGPRARRRGRRPGRGDRGRAGRGQVAADPRIPARGRGARWRILEAIGVSSGRPPRTCRSSSCSGPISRSTRATTSARSATRSRPTWTRCRRTPGRPHPAVLQVLDAPADDPPWQPLDPLRRRQHMLDALGACSCTRAGSSRCSWSSTACTGWIPRPTPSSTPSSRASPAARIFLLVTHRPEYQHPWADASHYTGLLLKPLPPDNAEQLLDPLLGERPQPAARSRPG